MRWAAQVGHVARKDLRQRRWLITGFVALIAFATTAAFLELLTPGRIESSSLAVFVYISGMAITALALFVYTAVLAAALVHDDAPTDSTAHWLTLPLSPSAVFAAKLLLLLTIGIGVPLVAQGLLTIPFDISTRQLTEHLGSAALVLIVWIAICLGLATLVPTMSGYILALISLVAVLTMLPSFAPEGAGRMGGFDLLPLSVAGFLVAGYLYVTRDRQRGRASAFAALCLSLLIGSMSGRTGRAVAAEGSGIRADAEAAIPDELKPTLRLGAGEAGPGGSGKMRSRVELTADDLSPDAIYAIRPRAVRFAAIRQGLAPPPPARITNSPLLVPPPALPGTEGFAWLGAPEAVVVQWFSGGGEALDAPMSSPPLEVSVEVARLIRHQTFPFGTTGRLEIPGGWIELLDSGVMRERLTFDVRVTSFENYLPNGSFLPDDIRTGSLQPLVIALRNPVRREAVMLRHSPRIGTQCCKIIPAGGGYRTDIAPRLELEWPGIAGRIDPQWLSEAEVVIAVYEPLGRYTERVGGIAAN